MNFDFIIVGAGSAGCILAERLTASGQFNVLLVEAGGPDRGLWFRMPAGYARSYFNPRVNWMYYTEPEPNLGGRRIYAPRGKVVGGSGSINAMIWVRGQRADFDDWALAGNPGWGFEDVLPYFRRIERHPSGENAFRGGEGPVGITPMKGATHPICDRYLEACHELGLPLSDDFNGAAFEGGGIYEANIDKGRRASSSSAYLSRARQRHNLTILTEHQVRRLTHGIDGVSIDGIEVTGPDGARRYRARREVILAAGAVGSPLLLQASGIGDGRRLSGLGIDTRRHLPAVGQNLQDHLCASFYFRASRPTLNDELGSVFGQMRAGLQYLLARRGPLALSVNQAGGFFRGAEREARANLQVYFNPLSYTIPADTRARLKPEPYSGYLMAFNSCRPTSRGSVDLRTPDPVDTPVIRPNYLSTDTDIEEVLQGGRLLRRLAGTQALRGITHEEVAPAGAVTDDDSMLRFFREQSGSIYHLCGTCAMGPDENRSVVDARLRVHGVRGLRVIDASIFPNITSGNINAPTMMVAEKGADLVLADHR